MSHQVIFSARNSQLQNFMINTWVSGKLYPNACPGRKPVDQVNNDNMPEALWFHMLSVFSSKLEMDAREGTAEGERNSSVTHKTLHNLCTSPWYAQTESCSRLKATF